MYKEVLFCLFAVGFLALFVNGIIRIINDDTPPPKWEIRCASPKGWVTHISSKTPPVHGKIRIFKIKDTYYTTCTFKQIQ